MANPYPMQQPPMMGNPMGNPMMRQPQMPARRGTPKAVPVIVSAGLAVGVFCGLLFGLGTGEDEAKADSSTTKDKNFVGTKIDGTDTGVAATGPTGPTPPKSVTDGTLTTGKMKDPKAGSGSAAPAAGSGSGGSGAAPTVVVPAIKMAKIVITVKPDTIKDAKITVDGVDVTNGVAELPLGDKDKKEVAITIKATGFKDLEQKLEVNEGETKAEYQLVKKSGGSSGVRDPKRPPPPGGTGGTKKGGGGTKKGGGGLIDI